MARFTFAGAARNVPLLALMSLAAALFLAACGTAPPGGGGGGGGTTCNDYREGTFTIVFDGRTYTNAPAESYGAANATQSDGVVGMTLNSNQADPDDYLRFNYAVDLGGNPVLTVTEVIGGNRTDYGFVTGQAAGGVTTNTLTANFTGSAFCAGSLLGDGTATGAA